MWVPCINRKRANISFIIGILLYISVHYTVQSEDFKLTVRAPPSPPDDPPTDEAPGDKTDGTSPKSSDRLGELGLEVTGEVLGFAVGSEVFGESTVGGGFEVGFGVASSTGVSLAPIVGATVGSGVGRSP